MSSLVDIIAGMLLSKDRISHQLPRGLWLVYYPPLEDGGEHRFVAGRHLAAPSPAELNIIRHDLLEALDRDPSHVVDNMTHWVDVERNDWQGSQLVWEMLPISDVYIGGDRAQRARRAWDTADKRRGERARKQTAAGRKRPTDTQQDTLL